MACEVSRGWTRIATWMCVGVLAVALTSCQKPDVEGQEPEFVAEYGIRVAPDLLNFGTQPVGSTHKLDFTIENTGNVDAFVDEIVLPSPDLSAEFSSPVIRPGKTVRAIVTWDVTRPVLVEGNLRVRIDRGDGEVAPLPVAVYGSGLGPDAVLSVSEYDFGDMALGCADQLHVTLSNAGTAAMNVNSVSLFGSDEFTLLKSPELPMEVPAFGRAEFTVQYRPQDDLADAVELRIESDQGAAVTRIYGTGHGYQEELVQLKANPIRPVVMLVFVNEVVAAGWVPAIRVAFEDHLKVLFEELKATGNPYRVAFVANYNGTIPGEGFIDHSVSPSRAVSLALDQSAVAAGVGDNDRMLDTLLEGIKANEDWMFDPEWVGDSRYAPEPRLVMVGVNDDADQGTTTAAIAVEKMLEYVEDEENLLIHGISGPLGGFTCAAPNAKFKEAVDKTGGSYHDICGPDWDDYWRSIVRNSVPPVPPHSYAHKHAHPHPKHHGR